MPDTIMSLGGFTFSGWGVPERVNGGGRQRVAIHRLIGGARVIDAMGWDADQLRFGGRMRGAAASVSVRLLETLARVGVPVVFSYWTNRYQVIVSRFSWQFERYYEIGYDLTLEVLADLTQDAWQAATSSLDDLFNADLALVTSVGSTLVALGSGLTNISATQSEVGPLQNAAPVAVIPLTAAVETASASLRSAQASLDAALPAGAPGQVVPGGDPAELVVALLAQAADCQQLAATVQAAAILERMQTNLTTVGQ
jgi:hypothetical protein